MDKTIYDPKYAIIIDHYLNKLFVKEYLKISQLINALDKSKSRYSIHRIFLYQPDEYELSECNEELFPEQ